MEKFYSLNREKIEREVDRLELEDELRSRGIREIGGFYIGGIGYRELVDAYFRVMKNESQIRWVPGWRKPGADRAAILDYCERHPDADCKEIGSVFDISVPSARGYKRQVTMERAAGAEMYSEIDVYDAAPLEF